VDNFHHSLSPHPLRMIRQDQYAESVQF
jgi:hypothetical protein